MDAGSAVPFPAFLCVLAPWIQALIRLCLPHIPLPQSPHLTCDHAVLARYSSDARIGACIGACIGVCIGVCMGVCMGVAFRLDAERTVLS